MTPEDDPPPWESWMTPHQPEHLFRRDAEADARWASFVSQQVDMLWGGLRPSDAWMSLPHFAVVHFWKTKRWGYRPGG